MVRRLSLRAECFRLLLALAILLSGVAGARLQGAIAGEHALRGAGLLCSPMATEPGERSGDAALAHQHCGLCAAQFNAAPDAPAVQSPMSVAYATALPVSLDAAPAARPCAPVARGPPPPV